MRILLQVFSGLFSVLLFCGEKGQAKSSWAKLYPSAYSSNGRYSEAENAIDGRTSSVSLLDCASTKFSYQLSSFRLTQLHYLEINLQRPYFIAAIKLHLSRSTQIWQNGLVVSVSNTSIQQGQTRVGVQCGSSYSSVTKTTLFPCWTTGQYVYALRRGRVFHPLQVCEIQIFKEMDLTAVSWEVITATSNSDDLSTETPTPTYAVVYPTTRTPWSFRWYSRLSIYKPKRIKAPTISPLSKISSYIGTLNYLVIDLGHYQEIYSVSLPLRAKKDTLPHVALPVRATNSSDLSSFEYTSNFLCLRYSVASSYAYTLPVFVCNALARYIWIAQVPSQSATFISPSEVAIHADIRCPLPTQPSMAQYNATRQTHGGSLFMSCDKGFQPSSRSPAVCEMSGNWSTPLPTCQATGCGSPTNIDNGFTTGDAYRVTYKCHSGYRLIGPKTAICQPNGQWNPTTPSKCQPFCYRPPNIANGRLEGIGLETKIDVGTSVFYTCNKGYALSTPENRHRKCLPNRRWSGIQPYCYEFSCSNCHKDADCVGNAYCRCKQGYVGNGEFCCPSDMGGEVVVDGATTLFRCDRSCNASFHHITWYKDGSPLDFSSRHGLLSNGMVLYVEKVTDSDTGEYMCEGHVAGATYQRHGSLDVLKSLRGCSAGVTLGCGRSCARKPFVARGVKTYAGQFPWQAMFCSPTQGQFCGGVLVSSDCIVTAAHCIVAQREMSICLGRQCGNCSETDSEGHPQCFEDGSFDISLHPQFSRKTLENDVAIIKLKQSPLLDCMSVYPVCLPNETRDDSHMHAREEGIVTGWGKVDSTVSRSTCLRQGNVRLASNRICDLRHEKYPITKNMMCATDYNGACEGDSGGPLVVQNPQYGNRYVLAGIVSWGEGCGKKKKLGVYTRVLSHLDWIKDTCGI